MKNLISILFIFFVSAFGGLFLALSILFVRIVYI
nr:MAG TPA: G-rich domain on putative tyrosine kinase [Bacteriophage sp.]